MEKLCLGGAALFFIGIVSAMFYWIYMLISYI